MKRYGSVVILRPEKISEYVQLHAAMRPAVLLMIKQCHLHNCSIYLRPLADRAPEEWWANMEEVFHLD